MWKGSSGCSQLFEVARLQREFGTKYFRLSYEISYEKCSEIFHDVLEPCLGDWEKVPQHCRQISRKISCKLSKDSPTSFCRSAGRTITNRCNVFTCSLSFLCLQLSFFAYSPFVCLLEALSHCKQQSSDWKQKNLSCKQKSSNCKSKEAPKHNCKQRCSIVSKNLPIVNKHLHPLYNISGNIQDTVEAKMIAPEIDFELIRRRVIYFYTPNNCSRVDYVGNSAACYGEKPRLGASVVKNDAKKSHPMTICFLLWDDYFLYAVALALFMLWRSLRLRLRFLAPPAKSRLFKASRCTISLRSKLASERRFL